MHQSGVNPAPKTVSVVMPAFNEAAHIGLCLERVLRQSRVTEVIVIDDGSTDGTPAIVEALMAGDPRLRLERRARNTGKGAALRNGFACATGDILIV